MLLRLQLTVRWLYTEKGIAFLQLKYCLLLLFRTVSTDTSGCTVCGLGLLLQAFWDCGFESRRKH
jgi:hypothetical protein